MLMSLSGSVLLTFLILIFLGWLACLFFLAQAATAVFLYGIVTYTQHYELCAVRKPMGNKDFTYMNVWSHIMIWKSLIF